MNTISAWDIYWVMQLDAIGVAAGMTTFLGLIFVPAAWGFAGIEIKQAWAYVVAAALSFVWMIAVIAAIFLPSSKTAAAMFVIPAIANNETIQKEAGDLYKIAKDGLRELVKPETAEKVEK